MTPSDMARPQPDAPLGLKRPLGVAHDYNVSESTVRRWIKNGDVDTVRVGRNIWVTVESLNRLFSGAR